MIIFLVIAVVVLGLLFGVSSIMQSYASAQQAQAIEETAKAAQMATFANVVVIVVMALVLLLILAGIVYLVIKLNRRPQIQPDRRIDRLEAGRRYGRELKEINARNDTNQSLSSPHESSLVVADDEQVEEFINRLFQDL